jgi:hypothetical protein
MSKDKAKQTVSSADALVEKAMNEGAIALTEEELARVPGGIPGTLKLTDILISGYKGPIDDQWKW